ncbi:LytTR family DNA-binding domain-containing protein [Telluribacter sp. SYSU D00476]|uniref:LytR/AlgR family response regulator transcription factor n=1 Tax=Telluribacter sp. SYSU D00476 TaxID=2811430 RepID=UPI001FF52FBA|nr:LytTR family DNA-binding domain-containing protein [Telluribacter sp. SYSU D00476]
MNLVIVEDESIAARRLHKMVQELDPAIEVVAVLDSIEKSVNWFRQHPAPDLMLLDIELVDGQSFEIFNQVEIKCPVIFTTAYDEYAIKAFRVNSIEYLLKPIQEKDLARGLQKFRELKSIYADRQPAQVNIEALLQELRAHSSPSSTTYRDRILVKQGQRMFPITTSEVAYFFTKERLVYACTRENRQYLVDFTMDELEKSLDSRHFFRANRQFIVEFKAVNRLNPYFNGKLKVALSPAPDEEVIISRDKATEFRSWLGG